MTINDRDKISNKINTKFGNLGLETRIN